MSLDNIIENLSNGILLSEDETAYIRNIAKMYVDKGYIDDELTIYKIINICNLIYNNLSNVMSPLDDDTYDRLIVLCNRQHLAYPIGAKPISRVIDQQHDTLDTETSTYSGPKQIIDIIPKDKMLFFNDLTKNQYPIYEDYIRDTSYTTESYKRIRAVNHNYNLTGTLNKCKFVLSKDTDDNPSVSVFERDFLAKHVNQGIVDSNNIALLASIKYDGVSIEGTIQGDTLVYACSRGDIDNDKATDLTPILGGIKFHRATNAVDKNETFGIRFECIITNEALAEISYKYKVSYVNPRNAVIGILSRLDSRILRDYLTLVPLESTISISNGNLIHSRLLELEFLNMYYTHGIDMRYTLIHGSYLEVLYSIKRLVEEADMLRAYSNFQYDGIVIEYLDPHIRETLNKTRSIPNYAIAIKFPPMKRESVFTHYTYSVGHSGIIVPKAHFLPVEFMGQIHDKTTVHSLKRFNELHLRPGDKVNLTLSNDVIVYLTKAPSITENNNPYEQFPTTCPCCHTPLVISESGDSALCPNFRCSERCIQRLANMLSKLNIKGIATESIRALNIHTLRELLSITKEQAQSILGDIKGAYVVNTIHSELYTPHYDYELLGSLGFSNIASRTWKLILSKVSLDDIRYSDNLHILDSLPGIGSKTIDTILRERQLFTDELEILSTLPMKHHNTSNQDKQVRFSGVRDEQLYQLFLDKGYDISMQSGITNSTYILIIPYHGYSSSSVTKAFKLINLHMKEHGYEEMINNYEQLNISIQKHISPYILTIDEAYRWISQ